MSKPEGVASSGGQKGTPSGGSPKKGYKAGGNKDGRPPTKTKFEGLCPELKGHIYDCVGPKQADLFVTTTDAIATYVGSNYDYGGDMLNIVEKLEAPVYQEPIEPDGNVSDYQKIIFTERYKAHAKKVLAVEENVKRLYSLVLGQCTDQLKQKIKAAADFEGIRDELNGIRLLILIRTICFNVEIQKNPVQAMHETTRRLLLFRQGELTVTDYIEQFQNLVDVTEHCGGFTGCTDTGLKLVLTEAGENLGDLSTEDIEDRKETAAGRYLAVAFILGADRKRYGSLIRSLENDYVQKTNLWPSSLQEAYHLLTHWKVDPNNAPSFGPVNDGAAFVNTSEDEEGVNLNNNGRLDKSEVICHYCKQKGHYKNECPKLANKQKDMCKPCEPAEEPKEDKAQGTQLLTLATESHDDDSTEGFQFYTTVSGRRKGAIPENWILLDNQSTVDVFSNPKLVSNIQEGETSMTIHTNAGTAVTNMTAYLQGYGTVWFHPDGIANILSLARVKEKYRVTFDSSDGNQFVVHKPNGGKRVFQQSESGLYYLEVKLHSRVLVETVSDIASGYSKKEVEQARLARTLQQRIGRPSTSDFIKYVEGGMIANCPINRKDIQNAEDIFGPDIGALKGKTVRRTPRGVRAHYVDVPIEIMERHSKLVLAGDLMFVNGIAFFVTISHHIHFRTAEMIRSRTTSAILVSIKQVIALYRQRGFHISHMEMDMEFEPLRGDLASAGIGLNITSADEHVPLIERSNRTVKERVRAIYNTLPFNHLPARLITEMVYNAVFWLNCFPPNGGGVSTQLSPRAIVSGSTIDFMKHCQLGFGTYVQTHEKHDNSMASRTVGALALRPSGNVQGGHLFYSLNTGKRISRFRFTPLPMPNEVIQRVHQLAKLSKTRSGLLLADRFNDHTDFEDAIAGVDGENIEQNEEQEQNNAEQAQHGVQDEEQEQNYGDPAGEIGNDPILGDQHIDLEENNEPAADPPIQAAAIEQAAHDMDIEIMPADDVQIAGVPPADTESDYEEQDEMAGVAEDDEYEEDDEDGEEGKRDHERPDRYGPRSERYNLRTYRPRDFSHLHTMLGSHVVDMLEGHVLMQYPVEKGIKIFGSDGYDAVVSEIGQLETRNVLEPQHKSDLSQNEVRKALQYLMYLKKKRCGRIKARGCADGRKQRAYINKEDASSPTVSIESVMLTCTIDAAENRDVATVDIPGAFMHSDMDEVVHMKMEGTMAEILAKISPDKYRKFVVVEKRKPTIYVKLKKALYGTLRAALLFWKLITAKLETMGFTVNPYDWCVANKMVDGHQCTVIWHVDDLKISHVSPDVVSEVIDTLNEEYGREAPLTVTRGRIHDYLGMTLDYREAGKVKIIMSDYVDAILDEAPPEMDGFAATPAAVHLFDVNMDDPVYLDEDKAEFFVHMVAKLLFLSKRARPDIQTAVAFLCTRVRKPDEDDYKKLSRVIKYLRGTKGLYLTLEAEDLHTINWWVDASFAVHPDMRSHTGGVMMLRKGAVYSTSTRQKLNTRSSTESELVAVNDVIGQVLWTKNFLIAQGYEIRENVIYQDNQSAILLEKNGRGSSSKRTRHIDIRYFFITDRVKAGDVKVDYCPTKEMLADFFTKPLQGSHFIELRDLIMNIDRPARTMVADHRSVLEDNDPGQARDSYGNNEPVYKDDEFTMISKEQRKKVAR